MSLLCALARAEHLSCLLRCKELPSQYLEQEFAVASCPCHCPTATWSRDVCKHLGCSASSLCTRISLSLPGRFLLQLSGLFVLCQSQRLSRFLHIFPGDHWAVQAVQRLSRSLPCGWLGVQAVQTLSRSLPCGSLGSHLSPLHSTKSCAHAVVLTPTWHPSPLAPFWLPASSLVCVQLMNLPCVF